MDQRSSLLEQLRIERSDDTAPRSRKAVWWSVGIVAVVAAGIGTWVVAMPRGVPVKVATAALVSADIATAPASILDASGYVVARRQATVSAKITGKVVAVAIEEGQRVERSRDSMTPTRKPRSRRHVPSSSRARRICWPPRLRCKTPGQHSNATNSSSRAP